MADVPVLLGQDGPLAGEAFPIDEGVAIRIGRADDNTVVLLGDDGVSRYHAEITLDNGSLWIRDVGSRNGTFVNDARVVDHRGLSVGDRVAVGASVFVVRWRGEAKLAREDISATAEAPARTRWRLWPFE